MTNPVGIAVTRTYVGTGATIYPSSSVAPIDAGTYQVTTTPTDPLIGGSEVAALTISPKPVTITIEATDRAYDGTTDVDLTFGLVGGVRGDDVDVDGANISGAFQNADAGVDKPISISTSGDLLTGGDAGNYVGSLSSDPTASISKALPVIEFTSTEPADATEGDEYTPTATSTSGGVVTFSVDSLSDGVCTVADGVISLIGAGLCTVIASSAATTNYSSTVGTQSFSVAPLQQPQVITVEGVADTELDDGPLTLPSTTLEGLPLTYTAGPSDVCELDGFEIVLNGIGTCEVTADQAGDATHLPATASASFEVTKITQSLTFPGLGTTELGDGPVTLPSETPGGLPLTYTAGPDHVCTLSGNVVTLVAIGTCQVIADQAGDDTHAAASAIGFVRSHQDHAVVVDPRTRGHRAGRGLGDVAERDARWSATDVHGRPVRRVHRVRQRRHAGRDRHV